MLNPKETSAPPDPELEAIIGRLVRLLNPERIYLFGSRARGDHDPESDYDLLVVVKNSSLPRYKRDQAAFRALRGVGVPKDVLVLTRKEFEGQRRVISSLPATVEREGALIYAA
jgi:uncharacterized protein